MLANVLKSEGALQMSVRIIEVFVKIREMLLTYKDILLKFDVCFQVKINFDHLVIEKLEFIRVMEFGIWDLFYICIFI